MNNFDVEVNGEKFVVDLVKARELGLLKPAKPVIKRHRGQHYKVHSYVHVLAVVDVEPRPSMGCKVSLINIENGTRYSDPVVVEDSFNITDKEWDKITSGMHPSCFKLVTTKLTIFE